MAESLVKDLQEKNECVQRNIVLVSEYLISE